MTVKDKYAQSIAVVFPAVISATHSLPIDITIDQHCTMVYLGEMPDVSYSLDDILSVLRLFPKITSQIVEVSGIELFGPAKDFLVLSLNPDGLADTKHQLVKHLRDASITVTDRFPDYRPHLTLQENYQGSLDELAEVVVPATVELGIPELWWGNMRHSFS